MLRTLPAHSQYTLPIVIFVAIIIIFQPELRRAFEDIGKGQFLSEEAIEDKSIEEMASDISKALNTCSEKHVGALVIIEQQIGLKEYIDNGVPLRAAISSELLVQYSGLFLLFTIEQPL